MMMSSLSTISEELDELQGQVTDIFRALTNGFQKLDKMKETSRQSRQLDDLTDKMRECKRLIKEFDIEVKEMECNNDGGTNRMLNERKQSMVKELNRFVSLKKQCASNLESKRADLFERPDNSPTEQNGLLATSMSNQELVDHGHKMMDETDQSIERSKQAIAETVEVGTETAATLKAQTEQMGRIVNELDSITFSVKKASKLVTEIGRQLATDRCIVFMLFLIVLGVIAIVIVKLVTPDREDTQDVPGLAPPVPTNRRLLWNPK